jgi:zinc and cadmium transporter
LPDPTSAAIAPWLGAVLSVVGISLLSLVGAATFLVRRETLDRIVPFLVSVAVGAMLGSAFFHLLPEISAAGFTARHGSLVLAGVLLFFLFERFVGWHEHGHTHHARVAPYAWLNLTGDALHNFADGLIIAAAWSQGSAVGLAATVAVALHEIPQELGDVGILLSAKLSLKKALLLNLATGLLALLGCVIGLALGDRLAGFHEAVLGVTAGGFIYIAAADLMPELHRERRLPAAALQVACLALGVAAMYLVQ